MRRARANLWVGSRWRTGPSHEQFSPGARPDVAILKGGRDRQHHLLLEVKVLCPLSSVEGGSDVDGAYAAFGATRGIKRTILGCGAVGGREAIVAKYIGAQKLHHEVVPMIFETFGGMEGAAVSTLNDWAARARGKTPPGEEPPWCARNYVPYWSQILSKEAQRGAAEEIISRVREETTACEAVRTRSG